VTETCCGSDECCDDATEECCNDECCDDDFNVSSGVDTICVGEDITFTSDSTTCSSNCMQWSGGSPPASATGTCSFTTSWDTAGVYPVAASTSCGAGDSNDVTVVEVESLLPNEGGEIDDGDGNPDTKSFVVCKADSGVVTVTATPNPGVAEPDLPSCWSLTGGTGTGKLSRTVDKTTSGVTTISCTAGTSSKTTKIYVVEGSVSLSSSSACDGEEVNVDLNVTPSEMKDYITYVEWQAVEPAGVTNYGNPDEAGLTFSQRGDITEWKINNARWYSNQAGHCNDISDWEIEALFDIGSISCCTNYDPPSTIVTFTASALIGESECMFGECILMKSFSGDPTFSTVLNQQTGLWETTVTQGAFVRDLQADIDFCVVGGTASQYYNMVKGEEESHKKDQMENASHVRWGTTYLTDNVMDDIHSDEPFTASDKGLSLAYAQFAYIVAKANETDRSVMYLSQNVVRCANESEAKNAVGASHRVDMPCTYSYCQ
jgi:hypothetical protein